MLAAQGALVSFWSGCGSFFWRFGALLPLTPLGPNKSRYGKLNRHNTTDCGVKFYVPMKDEIFNMLRAGEKDKI